MKKDAWLQRNQPTELNGADSSEKLLLWIEYQWEGLINSENIIEGKSIIHALIPSKSIVHVLVNRYWNCNKWQINGKEQQQETEITKLHKPQYTISMHTYWSLA